MITSQTQKMITQLAEQMAAMFTPPEYIPGCKVLSVADKDQYDTDNGWIEALCGRHNQQRCRWRGQLPTVAINDYVDVIYYPSYSAFVVFWQGGSGAAATGQYLLTTGERPGATSQSQLFNGDVTMAENTGVIFNNSSDVLAAYLYYNQSGGELRVNSQSADVKLEMDNDNTLKVDDSSFTTVLEFDPATATLSVDNINSVAGSGIAVADDLVLASGSDVYPNADALGQYYRTIQRSASVTDHFRSGVIPTGYAFDTRSLFWGTPSTLNYSLSGEFLLMSKSGYQLFLQKAVTNSAAAWQAKGIIARVNARSGEKAGVRIDDSVDAANRPYVNVYVENSSGQLTLKMQYRSSVGGGVTTTTTSLSQSAGTFITLQLYVNSIYDVYCQVVGESGAFLVANTGVQAWLPVAGRVGLWTESSGFGSDFDWFYNTFG